MKKDIYIIKNSVNDKVYIGQAKDAAERWLSHVYNAKYENKTSKEKQIIHKAMMKYGIDKFHYEILEYQVSNYDEREIYWIKHFNSIVPNGYNIAVGGNGMGAGCESVNSVFSNEEDLLRCISEISGTNKTFTNIAKKFGCSQEVISAINLGYRYKMDYLEYPLRDTNSRYSDSLVKEIRYSLKYEKDLSIKDIALKYSVDCSQVSLINSGRKYFLVNETYPLRKGHITDFDKNTVDLIVKDILYSDLCLSDIASKYNVSRSRITGINRGIHYRDSSLNYPLRDDTDICSKSLKKYIDRDVIVEIVDCLRKGLSISDISKKYGISKTTVININNGKCKKYLIDGVDYPIRKK